MATNPSAAQHGGYERSDASARGLVFFIIFMAAVLAATAVFLFWLFNHYERSLHPGSVVAVPFSGAQPPPPSPRIQAEPLRDIETYIQSQQNILNTYGWIDRQNGIVRMPIDRAMELLLERGLPVRSAPERQTAASSKPHNGAAENQSQPGGSP